MKLWAKYAPKVFMHCKNAAGERSLCIAHTGASDSPTPYPNAGVA